MGLPLDAQAVMVFASHLESKYWNEKSCPCPDYAKTHASAKLTATALTAKR
jgi:hypothetical protein